LTEPARTRVRDAMTALEKGLVKSDEVADLVRGRRGLQPIAIEIANYVAELKLAGAVLIDGPSAHSTPGDRGMWWGWIVQVFTDETTTKLALAERELVFDLQFQPLNDASRHSDEMKQAVATVRGELGAWLGRPVRLFEIFN
jgi:hypothetical protein